MSTPEEIETDIERARGQMADTLVEIEKKLSPNRWMDEAMDAMRSINLSDSRVVDFVRDNPVPLALVGVGLSWLVVASVRGSRSVAESLEDYSEAGYPASVAGAAEEAGDWAGYGSGNGGARGTLRRAQERAGEVAGTVRDKAADVLQGTGGQLAGRVGEVTRGMRQRAGAVAQSSGEMFQDHPLTIGFLAVMAGLAVGAALPRTRRERELLGDTGSELLETARQGGRDLLSKAGKVVQRAAETVSETGGEALRKTKDAARDEAQRQSQAGGPMTAH